MLKSAVDASGLEKRCLGEGRLKAEVVAARERRVPDLRYIFAGSVCKELDKDVNSCCELW